VVLWRILDGVRGHENQTLGLTRALAHKTNVERHDLPVPPHPWRDFLLGRFPAGAGLPAPDLILGAGHATHAALLAARRARGGRTVVLMKPSLPPACFDLTIAPRHDGLGDGDKRIATWGALNVLTPSSFPHTRESSQGALILIGGPSPHVTWDSARLLRQIEALLAAEPARHWMLTTSRRTPPELLDALRDTPPAFDVTLVPFDSVGPDWLPAALASSALAWVSADSVSMISEALTAGCAVGLLTLDMKPTRVTRGVREFVDAGFVTTFEAWQAGRVPTPPMPPFDEAGRCADWILEKWFAARPLSPTPPPEGEGLEHARLVFSPPPRGEGPGERAR
jgi:mitochondrial fission protein ELM1